MLRNPFLGGRPYGVAHSKLFFGRETARRELADLIELHPIVAVVAPSGIGKTSLLRAAVAPELEISGLSPVYMRPDPKPETRNDGALALLDGRMETAILGALLPDPALERSSLAAIEDFWGDIPLDEAAEKFAALNPADDRRAALLDPGKGIVERLPLVARFLNRTYQKAALAEQWRQLDEPLGGAFARGAAVGELAARLASPELRERAAALAVGPAVGDPGDGAARAGNFAALSALIRAKAPDFRLIRPDGDTELTPRIVLIIDQFEQAFTLSHPDNRDRLLAVLSQLADAELPMHIVLALRKEWFAELTRYLAGPSKRSRHDAFETFHLDSMSREEAGKIMVEVPRSVGRAPIAARWQDRLWENLQSDGMLDPVTLSIACHELFEATGADDDGRDGELPIASEDVEGLLATYLHRSLHQLDDDHDISEAIDILGEIAGSGSTRDFITQNRILNAPLRDRERRRQLLERLQQLFLIRGDSPRRGSDKLYDIMHERLIAPVRKLIASRGDIVRLREAAASIVREDATRFDLEFANLAALLLAADRLVLDARTAAIMLARLLQLDLHGNDKERAGQLAARFGGGDAASWFRRTAIWLAVKASGPAPPGLSATDRLARDWWLTDKEVQQALRRGPDNGCERMLLMSTLVRRTPGARTRRLLRIAFGNARSIPA